MHRTIIKDLLTSRTYCITVLYMYVLVYKKTIVLLRCFNILANSMSNNCGVKSRQWYFYVRSCEIVQIFSFACFSFPLRFYENVNLQIVSQTAFWVFIICLWPPCFYTYVTEYCATCWISKVANGEQVIVTIGDVMKHLAWHSRASTIGNTRARIFSHQQMGFTVLNPICQGWEFALCFFERIAGFFVTERAIRSWKRVNCSRRSFVKIDRIDSLLGNGINKGERSENIRKIRSLFFEERQERFAHGRSFVKSNKSESHFVVTQYSSCSALKRSTE